MSSLQKFANAFFFEVSKFDPITWAVLAVCSVVFGFFLLRGNILK